ncbi:MAG: acyl transferase [Spirosoma sp.]|nr:acyl transferase [Spirosoma sp.]
MSFLSTLSGEAAIQRQSLRKRILTVVPESFEPLALAVFRYQATHNPVYRHYLHCLNIQPDRISDLRRVPFMPISFFKSHLILTGFNPANETIPGTLTFASSGTTSQKANETSRHLVPDPDLYDSVSTRIFEQAYGPLRDFHILALLPSYLERNNSSLVYMVQRFMAQSGSFLCGDSPTETGLDSFPQSADVTSNFFLNNLDELTNRLRQLTNRPDGKRILLIGVTFALLDWAESNRDLGFLAHNPNLIVMETGGMKGRRKELLREEVHNVLTERLGIPHVHSEYGMTELLSQAYSTEAGIFRPSPTLRVFLRDINDPFHLIAPEQSGDRQNRSRQTGGINIVDLANLDSCSFIETQDLGQYAHDGMVSSPEEHPFREHPFRVIGRFDNSDVRGCNLMVI